MTNAPDMNDYQGFDWDEAKRSANVEKHGVDFEAAQDFDFSAALVAIDDRADYREVREIAIGRIGGRLHVMVYTRRAPYIRVIGLRKANKRERAVYAKAQT